MAKNVFIKGIDPEAYRRAKARAALEGISMGRAVSDALARWTKEESETEMEREHEKNINFVRGQWPELERHKGRAVVISSGKLQGVFESYEAACQFAARFPLALTFVVRDLPGERKIELGPDLEIQQRT